jgi:mono/diheme cytochrome c family protein
MQFFFGFVTAIVVTIVALLTVVWAGLFNVAATQHSTTLERLLAFAAARSIARHAAVKTNPVPAEPQALVVGLQHYADMCLMCHGAPGVEPHAFARNLSPKPPAMTSTAVQLSTDGELFWIISHGIMATGMPAFGPVHGAEDIWQLVAFIRHMPHLSTAEQQRLLAARDGDHHTGHAQGQAGHKH